MIFWTSTNEQALKNIKNLGEWRWKEYQQTQKDFGRPPLRDPTSQETADYIIGIFKQLLGPNAEPPYVVPFVDLSQRQAADAKQHNLSLKAEVLLKILDDNKSKTSLGLYDLLWTRYNNRQKPLGAALSLDRYPEAVQEYTRWARINSVEKGNDEWQKQFKNKVQSWKNAFGELSGHQKRALAPIFLEYAGTLYCQVNLLELLVDVAKNIPMKPSEAIQQALKDVSNKLAAPPSHEEQTDDGEGAAEILKTIVYGQGNTL